MKNKSKKLQLVDIAKIRWSPEIEVEFPHKKDSQKLIDRNRMLKGWYITYDGSLDNGAEYKPRTNNKLYLNEESLTQLKEVLAIIKVHKGKVHKSCGLHIHIDASHFTDKQVLQIITEFIHKQRYIAAKFNTHPDRLEHTCKLLPKEGLVKIKAKDISSFRKSEEAWSHTFYEYFSEKYYSLNITHLAKNDYGTLEFRIFNGTLNYKEFVEIIKYTLQFCKDAIERD